MIIKGLIDEDLVNYKKPCMTIEMPLCSFKCDKECGRPVCQNSELAAAPNIFIDCSSIVDRYINNDITSAIVFQGLEPFDTWDDLLLCINTLRQKTNDDIVIYTGYTEEEAHFWVYFLKGLYKNIIVKFGRFIPDQQPHYDEILGVELASDNQYAKRIS